MHRHILIALLLLSAGCITPEEAIPEEFQITVVDDFGRNVTLESYPQRIISTAPSNTEILFALGLGDRVLGVTEYCDYPEEAKEKEKIGGFNTVNIEAVVALNPDLVLASDLTGTENIEKLEELGITVVVLQPETIDGVLENIRLVGKVTGTEGQAQELTADMRKRIDAVQEKTQGLKRLAVFYVVWHDPLMSAGSDTFISSLITMAGGTNVAGDLEGYQVVSLETVIDANPDIAIASEGQQHSTYSYLMREERLAATSALKNNRVYSIDQDIVSRSGPRIVDGLEEFAKFIHPEAFEEA